MPQIPVQTDVAEIPPAADETFAFAATDESIRYPSYVSFDSFVDVERLRTLDGYLQARIRRHMAVQHENSSKFYTGPYRLDPSHSDRPGSRMIYLAESSAPDSYFDLDRTDLWRPAAAANDFSLLMDFIGTLPFEATGRMLIMYDDAGCAVPAHRDHIETEVCHEFLWFRTNFSKPFYMLNSVTGEKRYVREHTAWFDTVNQFHGSDASDGLSFSIRVDGRFNDDFRAAIPRPRFNAASTPSYWASFNDQGKVG